MPLVGRIMFRTALKQDWEQYCLQSGMSSSEALRQLISKLLTGGTDLAHLLNIPKGVLPAPKNSQAKHRVEIRLTTQEYDKLIEHAQQTGFSPAKWLVTLVRYQFIQHTPLTVFELDKLDERLYQVRMLGHNLNQVARALNSHELHPTQVDLMLTLQLLMQNLDAEKQALRAIASHNIERW
jgi:hypothetical protein